MACDGGGRPGRESKQCQRLMSGNQPGAEGPGRGTVIAHPDRRAGGGGPGTRGGGEHESRQRVPWRPDPAHRQTDGQGRQPGPQPLLAPIPPLPWPKGPGLFHHLSCRIWLPPLQPADSVGQRRPPGGGRAWDPCTACWEAGLWGLEALSLLGPRFPHLCKVEESRHILRVPPTFLSPSFPVCSPSCPRGPHPSDSPPLNLDTSNRPSSSGWAESTSREAAPPVLPSS